MVEITTREAERDDEPRLIDLWKQQVDIELQLDSRLQNDLHFVSTNEPMELYFDGYFNHNHGDSFVFVAEKNDVIVGFLFVLLYDLEGLHWKRAQAVKMVIDPHDGQGGVGTKLLKHCDNTMREYGIKGLSVDVPRHHAVQQAFWRAKGASVIQETFYLPIHDKDDE